ncbi:MAG: hypothetical protein AAB585_01500 [Patescibacteria group bacterium]
MPICKLCRTSFEIINNTHLASAHRVSISEYTSKFGIKGVGFPVNVVKLPKGDPRYTKWLRSLKDRNTAWSRGYTKETHPGLAKMAATFKERGIDNFKKWREEARKNGTIPKIHEPLKQSSDLAFLIGLVLGDGNIYKFPRTEGLRIALASKYPGLIDYTKKVVRQVFRKSPNVRKVKGSACYTVTLYQNSISNRLGIPNGNRNKSKFEIPEWITADKKYLCNFMRGMFEAEGSLSIHLPTCTYNFQFANRNKSLLKSVRKSLELLGYHPEVRPVAVRLRKKAEVESFRQLIKFRMY